MYYIYNIETNKVLAFAPEGPKRIDPDRTELIWVEEAYSPLTFDTHFDAEVALLMLCQYGGFNKNSLDIRVVRRTR